MYVSQTVLTTDDKGKPTFAAFGEVKTLDEWRRDSRCRVKPAQLRRNLFAGQTLEQALAGRNAPVLTLIAGDASDRKAA